MILGIDPGVKGAMAFLSTSNDLACFDMPHSIEAIVSYIRSYAKVEKIDFAVIEDVTAMTYVNARGEVRGQGAKASFNFGFGTGVLHGVLAALEIPCYQVKPATWKLALGLSSNKDLSRELAQMKFPQSTHLFQRKKDDGRAEAALLAFFGKGRFK